MFTILTTFTLIDVQDQEEVKNATSGEEAKKVTKVAKENKVRLSKENREEIFKSMGEQCMWKLSTGRFVEKELYRLGQELEFEQLNLTKFGPHVPDLPDQIAEFLYEFVGKTSLNEIREAIKSKMFGNNYDHENHHDKDYIIYAFYSCSRNSRWEHERHDWFNCHIWSVIFDQAFGDINVISDRQLPKVLKDILVKLMKKVDWNRKSVLNNPENFPYILKILASALNLKTVIKETLKVIQANEQTIESFKTARR
ncbi:hypothetical protein RhiirC2_791715 [Rhizophagus irregularis]|uniref:Uncharacterized protein n=1 Tax=Rhizophagus irregularis TaxID=588596 RepID=A0A2N1MIP6_9GLOM|nr:hypothetical protein RhiirC2_791715 [Rhizophagus irregularis]